jgi:putative addiction module killer protein
MSVITLIRSGTFTKWLAGLKDLNAQARIAARLDSARFGNFGDCKPIGNRVWEMRIHVGAGYRVYYIQVGSTIYVILGGGDKSSQKRDITRVKKLALEWNEEK